MIRINLDRMRAHGIECVVSDKAVEFHPREPLSTMAARHYAKFAQELGLSERESDEVLGYAVQLQILALIKRENS